MGQRGPRAYTKDDKAFAAAVTRARKRQKITVYSLAKSSGVSAAQIYRLENTDEEDVKIVTYATAVKLARALGISVDEIAHLGQHKPKQDNRS